MLRLARSLTTWTAHIRPPTILRSGFGCAQGIALMPVSLYMDVHVPQAVTEQLLRRNVDVVTAIEDEAAELADDDLLDHYAGLGRLLVTFDVRFKAMAEDWQRSGRQFGGLVYAHPLRTIDRPIGS